MVRKMSEKMQKNYDKVGEFFCLENLCSKESLSCTVHNRYNDEVYFVIETECACNSTLWYHTKSYKLLAECLLHTCLVKSGRSLCVKC